MARARTKTPPVTRDFYDGESRYLLCPSSEHLHRPMGTIVYPSSRKARPMATCSCGTRVLLSGRWHPLDAGYTANELLDKGIGTEGDAAFEGERGDVISRRYVVCPCSYFLHAAAHATPVLKLKVFYSKCFGCGSTWFYGPGWTNRHGFTLEEVRAMGCTIGG